MILSTSSLEFNYRYTWVIFVYLFYATCNICWKALLGRLYSIWDTSSCWQYFIENIISGQHLIENIISEQHLIENLISGQHLIENLSERWLRRPRQLGRLEQRPSRFQLMRIIIRWLILKWQFQASGEAKAAKNLRAAGEVAFQSFVSMLQIFTFP